MATREQLQAKADATRLRNLLTKQADKKTLTPIDRSTMKRLQDAKAKAKINGS